jgi:hypothetical protein
MLVEYMGYDRDLMEDHGGYSLGNETRRAEKSLK